MFKKNSFWLGFFPGIIIPILFVIIFVQTQYKGDLSMLELLKALLKVGTFKALLAVSAIPNMLVFYYFMRKEWWMSGRGMTFAMMLYAISIVILSL